MDPLSPRDRVILAFEEQHGAHDGAKEERIRSTFGHSPARHYQLVNRILDDPAALVEQPMLVKRLLRERHRRTEARTAHTFKTA